MLNTDKLGILGGLAASAAQLLKPRIEKGKNVRWGFFVPSGDGFKFIDRLVKKGQVRNCWNLRKVYFSLIFFYELTEFLDNLYQISESHDLNSFPSTTFYFS